MPQKLLIEVIARNNAVLEDAPLISGFHLFLGFVNRKGADVLDLSAIDLDSDGLGVAIVAMVDAEAVFEVFVDGDVGRRVHRFLGQGEIVQSLQGEDGLSVVGVEGFGYEVPALFPGLQKVRNNSLALHGLLIVRPVIAFQALMLVDGLKDDLDLLNTGRSLHQKDLVLVLDGQLCHTLNVICRQEVLIEGLVGIVLDQLVFPEAGVVLDLAREGLQNEILVPGECPRGQISVVQRRIAVVLVDFLQAHRPPALQEVDEI